MPDAPSSLGPAPPTPLAALARAPGRAGQLAALERSLAEEEALRAMLPVLDTVQRSVVEASRLRTLALLALRPAVELPESPLPAGAATRGARERLVIEAGEQPDPAALAVRWRAELAARNPGAAAHAEFARFTEDLGALPGLALALRDVARAARTRRLAPAAARSPLTAALTTLSPWRWPGLHGGVPAAWLAAAVPARLEPGPFARLAAECDAALEAAGRLRESQQSPTWELAALASLVYSRVCSALALVEELSIA